MRIMGPGDHEASLSHQSDHIRYHPPDFLLFTVRPLNLMNDTIFGYNEGRIGKRNTIVHKHWRPDESQPRLLHYQLITWKLWFSLEVFLVVDCSQWLIALRFWYSSSSSHPHPSQASRSFRQQADDSSSDRKARSGIVKATKHLA